VPLHTHMYPLGQSLSAASAGDALVKVAARIAEAETDRVEMNLDVFMTPNPESEAGDYRRLSGVNSRAPLGYF
jgi:hypothetical protein